MHTARYAGEAASYDENVDLLLSELVGHADRTATFRTAIALVSPDGWEVIAEGSVNGEITESRRGEGGFGYDPIFSVDGVTFSEMGAAEKHRISHRAMALREMAAQLRSLEA